MRRWLIPILVFASAGLVLSVVGLVTVLSRSQAVGPGANSRAGSAVVMQPDPRMAGLAVPAFRMTDQEGREQTEAMLDGRITVLDFIFTNCPFACPTMTREMHGLSERLKGTDVRFLSISVDPQRDTPARLKEFAQAHGADTGRWTFLTGDEATVKRIVFDSLEFALEAEDDRPITLPDGSTMNNIVHPTKLMLIGPDRGVIGFFDPNSDEDMQMLEIKAKTAAKEARGG